MGLDMYLSARKYIPRITFDGNGSEPRKGLTFDLVATAVGAEKLIDQEDWTGLSVQIPVGYWRKANHIHKWFVDNVQLGEDNCEEHRVTIEQLEQLKRDCEEVLNNPLRATALLKTQEGFFFGGTEMYDQDGVLNQYYAGDIAKTIDIINKVLNNPERDSMDYTYQSSW